MMKHMCVKKDVDSVSIFWMKDANQLKDYISKISKERQVSEKDLFNKFLKKNYLRFLNNIEVAIMYDTYNI